MHDPRPRQHEKSSRDLTGKAENEKRNIIEFSERRKPASSSEEFFGIEESELSTNEPADQPKLELLSPEKILLGFAVVVAVIILGVLLLLLITWPT